MAGTAATAALKGPPRPRLGWCLPRPIQNFGVRLLAQQLWCWGRDIERSQGNLLLQTGFEQHRYRGDEERSTCYRLDDGQTHICLWGFGLFYGHRSLGGLFLNRFDFCPQWSPVESLAASIHQTADLPSFGRPSGLQQWQQALQLWTSLQDWIAGYEKSVCADHGNAYRRKCVRSWMQPYVRADRMASAWRFLSRRDWEQPDQPVSHTFRRFLISAQTS